MKKLTSAVAVLLIMCTFFSSCDKAPDNSKNGIVVTTSLAGKPSVVGNIPCEFPLVNNTASFNIMNVESNGVSAGDIYIWQKYEEMTGIDVNWTTVTKDERAKALYDALMNKTPLDLVIRCKVSARRLMQYGESGLILDLAKDGMLEKYAPNCWAYLKSHPEALASVTNPDGTIYALPQVNSGAELSVSRKIFINKKWLENVNMQLPSTTEELYALLKAFKELDANGNGDPSDEIPLCSQDLLSLEEALYGSFGIGNRGVHNLFVDAEETTGKARLIAGTDGYRDYLEYMNRLYSEGLLDKSVFTITLEQWTNYAANDCIGVFSSTNLASLPSGAADNWVAVEEALEGPEGYKKISAVRANFHSTGAALIPSTCTDPALVLRWLDYFWTDEGTLFYHMGIENDTFVVKEDGSYDYSQKIYDEINSSGKSFDAIIAKYSPYPGGGNPTVEIAPYFMGGEMAEIPAAAARKLFEYRPEEFWPSFTFTNEENDRISILQADISKHISSSMTDFITGKKSFDEWDSYLSQLHKLGSDELVGLYQNAVDRYTDIKSNIK
ncbi:MAG: extracellular solute-binding protein [Clostridiales bacterium]|nr:extracellular solute-binding protein [Clostridiales bacterium]